MIKDYFVDSIEKAIQEAINADKLGEMKEYKSSDVT